MVPSLSAPSRTWTSISWRGLPAVWHSRRLYTSRAALPVFQVTKAGYTSATAVCLAPKPPPTRVFSTRILLLGMSSARARMRRRWNTIWVEDTTWSRPKVSSSV